MANFSAQIDDELMESLVEEAETQDRTLSAQLRLILRERYGVKKKK